MCTQGSRFNKVNQFYCCISQRFPMKQYTGYGKGMQSPTCIHLSCYITKTPSSLGVERSGKGNMTWLVLQYPFPLASQGTLEWSLWLRNQRQSWKKSHTAWLWNTVKFWSPGRKPSLFCLEQVAPPMRAFGYVSPLSDVIGDFRGLQSLVPTSKTFLTSAVQNCLKCLILPNHKQLYYKL